MLNGQPNQKKGGDNGTPRQKGGAGLIAASLFFLVMAVFISRNGIAFFSNIRTIDRSANKLFEPFPLDGPMFSIFVRDLLGRVFHVYLIPALLLGIALFLLADGMSRNSFKSGDFMQRLGNFFINRRNLIVTSLLFIGLLVLLRYYLIGNSYYFSDSFAYSFQGRVFTKLRFWMPSPEPLDSYYTDGLINNGKWFAKYTPGFPLLLALPSLLDLHYYVNPVLGLLCLWAVFVLGRDFYDRRTGIAAALLLLITPNFLLNNLALLVHPAFMLAILLFLIYFNRTLREKNYVNPVLAGASFGFALITRPADAALPGLLFIAGALWFLIRFIRNKEDFRPLLFRYFAALLPALGFLGFLLLSNKLQTGNPFLFGFTLFNPDEKWGFGALGHTPLRGLWNSLYNGSRFVLWGIPLTIELALVSLFEKKKKNFFLFLLALCPLIFYFPYYALGMTEIGTRFYHLSIAPLVLLAARGLIYLEEKFRERLGRKLPFTPAFLVLILVFATASLYPAFIASTDRYGRVVRGAFNQFERIRSNAGEKIVIFFRNPPGMAVDYYTQNMPELDFDVIKLVYLDEETNEKALERYPDRKAYTADYDQSRDQWIIQPWRKSSELSKEERLYGLISSAVIYASTVRNREMALKQVDRALQEEPERAEFLNVKADVYELQGEYDKAASILKEVLKRSPDNPDAVYKLAMVLYKQKEYGEAADLMEKYIATGVQGKRRLIAVQWLNYLKQFSSGAKNR